MLAPMRARLLVLLVALALTTACSSAAEPAAAPEPAPEPAAAPAPEPEPAPVADTEAAEACARVIVVAWQGAPHAPETVTRTRDEARARAEQLRGRIVAGEELATLARTESDAGSSGPRGGMLGTYTREDWPEAHAAIRDAVWALPMGTTSEILEAPYGFVVMQRCAVQHLHTRHILVRYAGARNAGDEITRSREEAEARARELLAQAQAPGADFAALAREHSEDGSAERGGDVGSPGLGRLQQPYEEAALALPVNGIAGPVETVYGFHVIQRLPE